jgi:DMSO/TMAO reductase YedYZ heme-binding membrane subunit
VLLPGLRAIGSFLDYYCGVFALVSLSLTVMVGVLATDRVILSPSHRVRAQAAHRALAFLAVAMLLLHLASQIARHRVGAVQAFVPLSLHDVSGLGLGTLAFYLLIVAFAGGIARGRFAAARRPWVWRALHLTAYAAWPLGVLHGLTSGRPPAHWVTAGYLICLAGVALALAARPFLRRRAGRTR